MKVQAVRSIPCHVLKIAEHVREADRQELYAASCMSPEAVMVKAFDYCEPWTGLFNGVPVCMFGVNGDDFTGVGVPWMVGTDWLDKNVIAFLRGCKPVIEQMLEAYPLLVNYVDVRNTLAIRWLKWLGFTIENAKPYGPFGMPFHRFELRR